MTLLKLLNLVKWPKALLFTIIVLSIASAVISLALPILTRDLIDAFTNNSASSKDVITYIVIFAINGLAGGTSFYLIKLLGSKIMFGLRETIFSNIIKLPVSYYDRTETGVVISRMTDDVETINDFITEKLTNLISQVIIIVGSITMLFILDWKLTVLIFIAIPIILVVIIPIGNLTYKIAMEKQDTLANFTGLLNRVLSEIRLVKVYNAEKKS